jgi:hypothetical protein
MERSFETVFGNNPSLGTPLPMVKSSQQKNLSYGTIVLESSLFIQHSCQCNNFPYVMTICLMKVSFLGTILSWNNLLHVTTLETISQMEQSSTRNFVPISGPSLSLIQSVTMEQYSFRYTIIPIEAQEKQTILLQQSFHFSVLQSWLWNSHNHLYGTTSLWNDLLEVNSLPPPLP